MSAESLIVKHRPEKFSQVVGQDDVVKSYRSALDDNASHAFLFAGQPGLGKTTLARLGAKYVGTSTANLTEVDAATFSGVNDMRDLTATLSYRPLGKNSIKSLVIDECHALSKAGWQSLLKMVEEPPEWVRWFFSTTDISKVPDSIKSRCAVYTLKPLRVTELFEYLLEIAEAENFDTPRQIIDLCAKQANGSPRMALSNLAVCYAAKDRAEAARLISDLEATVEGTPFALAKAIADGWKWDRVQPLLLSLAEADTNAETVRHTIRAYFTKVILGTKEEAVVCKALKVLDNFSEPCSPAEGLSPIVIGVGRSLF